MSNEHAIRNQAMALAGALAQQNEGAAASAAMLLLTQALIDLNKIATALEKLAAKG